MTRNLYHYAAIILTVFSFAACKKSSSHQDTGSSADTLTQNIYTISSGGVSASATILCAPFSVFNADSSTPGLLLVMDQDGKVLQKKITDQQAFCFRRWSINGKTRYSYLMNDVNAYRPTGTGNFAGIAIVTDSSLNELWRAAFIPSGTGAFNAAQSLDVHDFILFGDNHYMVASYYPKNVSNIPAYLNPSPKVQVFAPLIQEVNNGVVVWQWDGSSDTSFYANAVEGNHYADSVIAQDYMHLNAMYIDSSDNNLVCSFRHQDQILKISRTTGAILWRLGGKNSDFNLSSDQVFLRQHDPSLTDNNQTMLVFDNGESTLRPSSRILEFRLDEVNKVVTSFKAYTIPEPFSQLMGSVQKSGDEYFIGGGTGNYMLEVNSVTGEKLKEFKGGAYSTYRAYSYPAN